MFLPFVGLNPLLLPAAVAAGGSLLTSLVGGIFGRKSQSDANKTNLEIARQNNQTSINIARENNLLQERMNQYNNEFNRQMAIDMFNMNNAYNTPQAQKARLMQAGLNPNAMMAGEGAIGQSDMPSATAAGSGIQTSMPNLQQAHVEPLPSVAASLFEGMESASRVLANIKKSNLDDAQAKQIRETLGLTIDKLNKAVQSQEIRNEWDSFLMNLDKANLPARQQEEINRIVSEIEKNYHDAGAADAAAAASEALAKLNGEKFKQLHEQAPYILANIQKLGKLYDEQAETERTKQQSNKANATYYYASAKEATSRLHINEEQYQRLKDTHDAFVQIEKLRAGGMAVEYEKAKATYDDYIKQMHNAGLISDSQVKQYHELAEKARKENTMFYWDKVFNYVERINNGANKWMPWALSRDGAITPEQGMNWQNWNNTSTLGY